MTQTAGPQAKRAPRASDHGSALASRQSITSRNTTAPMAASIGSSPVVQALTSSKTRMDQSSRVQGLAQLAAEINQAPSARSQGVAVNDDTSPQHEADITEAAVLEARPLDNHASAYPLRARAPRMDKDPSNSVVQRFDPKEETTHLQEQADKWRPAMFWHSTDKKRRDQVLKNILKEASLLLSSGSVRLQSIGEGGSGMTPKGGKLEDRTYTIKLNTANPWGGPDPEFDPTENRMRSVILHELIHVASDQTYRFNEDESEGSMARAWNVDSEDERESDQEDARIDGEILRIRGLVDQDPAFSQEEKQYVKFRLNRARSWQQELDTVMSELVYYFDMQGVPPSSPTSVAVTALAEERYNRRSRREGPIAQKDRLLTEKLKKELWNQTLMSVGGSEAAGLWRE